MYEPVGSPCAQQLLEWHARYDVVNAYHRALRFLALSTREASLQHQERVRELNKKLSRALIALREASDHLRLCEGEPVGAR